MSLENKVEDNVSNKQEFPTNSNYISILDCTAYNDQLDKQILTYYYDKNEVVERIVVTIFWNDLEEANTSYKSNKGMSNYKNVKQNGKIITFEYTEEAINKYYPGMTKSSAISSGNFNCSGDSIVKDFKPSI